MFRHTAVTAGVAATAILALALSAPLPAAPEWEQCASGLGQARVVPGEGLGEHLEILSWNIQKASNDGWAEDLADLASDIHLAFLQEASVQAEIPGAISSPLHEAFTAGYTTASRETGVMTLSSHAPSLHCGFTSMEPWLRTPKASAVTEYPLAARDERLLTINLHAVNFAMGLEEYQEQIGSLASLLSNHEGPAILAGDFNTWNDARQALVDRLLGEHGLSPVLFQPDLRTRAFGRALDHIYVRGMEVDTTEVVPVSSSDHNALRARLKLQ